MKKQALVGSAAAYPLRKLLTLGMDKEAPDPKTQKRNRELIKRLIENAKHTGVHVDIAPPGTTSAHFDPTTESVAVESQSDPGTLAHELGHADIHLGKGRLVQNPVTTVAGLNMPGLGVLQGLAAASGAVSQDARYNAAGVIATAATLPVIGYEAWASIKGIKKLREAGATEEEVSRAKRHLLRAWGTYALLAPETAANVWATPHVIRAMERAGAGQKVQGRKATTGPSPLPRGGDPVATPSRGR